MKSMSYDFVTLGESLVCFQSFESTTIKYSNLFRKSIAGAESNVAIALRRLGYKTKWMSALGKDSFGELIHRGISHEAVDVELEFSNNQTGIFFKEYKGYADTNVIYFRKDSPASQLTEQLVQNFMREHASIKHISGITLAISKSNREILLNAYSKSGTDTKFSFDPNLRSKLWTNQEASHTITALLQNVDYYFPSVQEFRIIHDLDVTQDNIELIRRKYDLDLIVVKTGKGGIACTKYDYVEYEGDLSPFIKDTAGAGDAFVAGVLAFILEHNLKIDNLSALLAQGHKMGSIAVQFESDWEGLPNQRELQLALSGKSIDTR